LRERSKYRIAFAKIGRIGAINCRSKPCRETLCRKVGALTVQKLIARIVDFRERMFAPEVALGQAPDALL
jgi:hypothetical protein